MATTVDFMEFVMDQLADCKAEIRYKKMFGEYLVYVNDKPMFLVCDNTVFVKQWPCLKDLMEGMASGEPYTGAKPHYILNMEDSESVAQIIALLEPIVPIPKPRKKLR